MSTHDLTRGTAKRGDPRPYHFSVLTLSLRALREWRRRKHLQERLNTLDDRELTDIGIARCDIDYVASIRYR
jgi:uncharacterized protein YjiS (DUF1127 family)